MIDEQTIWVLDARKQEGLETGADVQTPSIHVSSLVVSGTVVNNLPITENTENLQGVLQISFSTDYYNHIHISPNPYDLGNVFEETDFLFTIWNSYLIPQTLSSVDESGSLGLTLQDTKTVPYVFGTLEERTITLNVVPEGPATINALYTFNFTDESSLFSVIGLRSIIWAFPPLKSFTETRQWLTDIVRSKEKEQRFTLREQPRTSVKYTFKFRDSQEESYARALANQSNQFPTGIPLWINTEKVSNIPIGATTIPIDTITMELRVGGQLLLWLSYLDFEVVTILSLTASIVTLSFPVTSTRNNVAVTPLLVGYLEGGVKFSQRSGNRNTASISLTDTNTYSRQEWDTVELLDSLPILTVPSVITGGLSSLYSRDVSKFNNPVGNIEQFNVEEYNRFSGNISIIAKTPTELDVVRRQFDLLQGKYSTFWLPSFTSDAILVNVLSAGGAEVRIIAQDWFRNSPIAIRIVGDVIETHLISTVTLNEDGTESIGLVNTLVSNIDNVSSIQVMYKVRLSSDSIDYVHSSGVSKVKVKVIGVNE